MKHLALMVFTLLTITSAAMGAPLPEYVKTYGPSDATSEILVRGTTDIELFEISLIAFLKKRASTRVIYEQWNSNDLYQISRHECDNGQAAADLIISSSIDQQIKLANDGCSLPYRSALTSQLPAEFIWRDDVFGVTREPAVIVYNRKTFVGQRAPESRFDLIDLLRPSDSPYRSKVATYDIESSGLGYLFAFADAQQATTYGSLLEALGRSGAITSCCSSVIIDGIVSGEYLLAYNVLGSYALARAEENPDIVVVAPNDYTLILSRAALIPKHARSPDVAGSLIDFLLSEPGRETLASSNLLVQTAEEHHPSLMLPQKPTISLRPIRLSPALLVGLDQHKRREFILRWRSAFRPTGQTTDPPPN